MSKREPIVFARIHPPRPLEPASVEALLLRLASDPASAPVVFETRASAREQTTSYWLGTTAEDLRWLRRTCHDLLPGLILDATPTLRRSTVTTAARVRVRPPGLALAIERPEEISRALLSALNQQLLDDEQLVVQIILGKRRPGRHRRKKLPDPGQPWWSVSLHGTLDAPTAVTRQHDQRYLQAGFATCIRFGVRAETAERRGRLLAGLLGGFGTAKAPGVHVDLVRDRPDHLDRAIPPIRTRMAPSAAELVGLLAWPLGDQDLPGLPPLHPRLLPAPTSLKEQERVFGTSNLPGDPRPIGISTSDSLFHFVAQGPTGSGKSTAMLHLIKADIAAGRPVLVLDPKRQLVDDIVATAIPEERIDDVVILDPAEEQVPGFNPLDIGTRDPDVVVDGLLAALAGVFHDGWGPRTQDIIHSGLLTLARVSVTRRQRGSEPFTLLDLPRLFIDPAFRRSAVGHVAEDPGLAQFWAWFDNMSPSAQAAALAAPANKLRQYLLRPSLRRILGQPSPAFKLRDLFLEHRIVLVPLNEALIGPLTAQLLGSLIVSEAWAATLERATESEPMKRPASIWVDEVQNYLHLPTSIGDALNASRSMGVAWHLAHQFRSQLPPPIRAAVDSNAGNKLIFRPNDPDDARDYARQAPDLEVIDFMSLPQYTAYTTLMAGGEPQPWCSVATLPPPPPTGLADRIRSRSRANYGGRAPAAPASTAGLPGPIDASSDGAGATPVGRKRRDQ